jgi:exodeoxyribonuclease V beta subunit
MAMNIDQIILQGMNLVEASAGTGKTHALTSLYLRLLLEQGVAPESILVMTYTQAATAELKTRIRQRLIEARQLFAGGDSSDPLLLALYQKLADKERVCLQLDLAVASFDRAAIFTIHGFCQRVLTEFAFESGQTFQTALVPDQAKRLQQIADDFWRREMDHLPAQFLEALHSRIATPDKLLSHLKPALGKPYLQVRGAEWPANLMELENHAIAVKEKLRILWKEQRPDILALLSDSSVLKGNVYRAGWVEGWCIKMDHWLQRNPYEQPFDKIERFTPSIIEDAVKSGKKPPKHAFFGQLNGFLPLVTECVAAYQQAVMALHKDFYNYLIEELPRRQAEAGEWSYDDLLLQLQLALQNDASGQLTTMLRNAYPAALVDEFQDTDPIQYEILERIYHGSDQAVFLVGDPKQAIYSFRGADIYTYLHAQEATGAERHSLDTNWRSTPDMIQAINALFSLSPHPFFDKRIAFEPTACAPRKMDGLSVKGKPDAALQIWHFPNQLQNLEELRQAVADATASEIAQILSHSSAVRVKIGKRDVCGSDIAILVRTHQQASRLAQALRVRGVHSVRSSQQSVYWSHEAEILERVLIALLEPHRGSLVRAALATPLFGWDAKDIDGLNRDERALSDISRRFFSYHKIWRESGFIAMFRGLMMALEVESRLLRFQDGERRLTNLYHLVELLQQQDSAMRLGMEGLVTWFCRQRQSGSQEEEHLLRLESDGHLVKIDTLHHSKGLEYGIVFCPYLWDEGGGRNDGRPFLFHDPEENEVAVLELGSESFEKNRIYRQTEDFAENLRLLYVALTRSRFRCYLPWGLNERSRHSALSWLLHSEQQPETLTEWQGYTKSLDNCADEQRLEQLQKMAQGTIKIVSMPQFEANAQLLLEMPPELSPARRVHSRFAKHLRVSSFSSLAVGQAEDLPDHDGFISIDDYWQEHDKPLNVHGFPRGAGPGSCLHAILEELNFNQPEISRVEALVEAKLILYAIDVRWTSVVTDWMIELLKTPLNAEGLTLGQISSEQCLKEMEFYFPVTAFEPMQIRNLAERHHFSNVQALLDGLSGLKSETLDGFIKGFIDLVFEAQGRYYLADYKSNWLGMDYSDYHSQALCDAMVSHHYTLQYVLYTLAVHRYLRLRIPDYDYERHFGGVFYLFLRGMWAQDAQRLGIVAERPSAAFIAALDEWVDGVK